MRIPWVRLGVALVCGAIVTGWNLVIGLIPEPWMWAVAIGSGIFTALVIWWVADYDEEEDW